MIHSPPVSTQYATYCDKMGKVWVYPNEFSRIAGAIWRKSYEKLAYGPPPIGLSLMRYASDNTGQRLTVNFSRNWKKRTTICAKETRDSG